MQRVNFFPLVFFHLDKFCWETLTEGLIKLYAIFKVKLHMLLTFYTVEGEKTLNQIFGLPKYDKNKVNLK